ncbi:integrase, catalytic region, zinc finger, CCHC-type containing protein [Tanacetum coccineum]
MEYLNFNSQERELRKLKQLQDNAKESCMVSSQLLHSYLKALSKNDSKGTCIGGGFEQAFATLFEKDVQTFTRTMLLNLDQLEKQLFKEEFQELESFSAFRVLLQQFQTFLYSRFSFNNDEGLMIRKYFIAYTKTDVPLFHDKLIQHMESLRESIQERAKHKRDKALDAGLVVTESNETELERHVSSSRSGKDTHAEDADINSVNDKQPMAKMLTKVDNEPLNGSNEDITNPYECKQMLNVSVGTLNLSAAPEVIAPNDAVVALAPVESTGSPSSTTVDQDAPSPSNSQTTPETQSPVISNDVEEYNHNLDVAHMNNDPFFGILIPKNDSEASSSSDVIHTIVHTVAPNSEHVNKWTKDHPLDNIIGELERHVSTRLQVYEQALFCYYDAFLTSVEAMQGELNKFEYPTLFIRRQGKDILLEKPTEKHLHAVKRIFKYLRGTVNRGLWYPKDSSNALTAYADADHVGCQDTRRSTSGTLSRERIEFLINKLGMRSFTPETLKQLADEVEE